MNSKNSQSKVRNIHFISRVETHKGNCESFDFFSQFEPKTEWADGKENEEVNVWEDNWDDDNVEDDFNQQLRAQLESQKK